MRFDIILVPCLKLLLLMYPVHQVHLWSLTWPYLLNSHTTLCILWLHCHPDLFYIMPGLLHQCPSRSPCSSLPLHLQHGLSRQRSCQTEFTRCFCVQYILIFLSCSHSKGKRCLVTNEAPHGIANFLFPSLTHLRLLSLSFYCAMNISCLFSPQQSCILLPSLF